MGNRLLLVEDDVPTLRVTTQMLQAAGYAVTATDTGEEAAQLLASQTFDIVVTDFHLPGINGAAVIETARRSDPRPGLVIITGNRQGIPDTLVEGPAAVTILDKPYTIQRLIQAMRAAQAGRR